MKPSIVYYSDCPFFAGCENMLANFFNSKELRKECDISFIYKFTPAYEQGLNKRAPVPIRKIPVYIYDHYDLYNLIDTIRYVPLRKPLKILINVLLIKYLFLLLNTMTLLSVLRVEKPDILHINNGGYPGAYSALSMVFAGKMCDVNKIIFVVNNIARDYRSPERWLDYPFDRFIVRWVAAFVTGSQYAKDRLHENIGVPEDKIVCIHNGIVRRVITESRDQVIKRLGIPGNRMIFTVIANLEERKGQVYFLKALRAVNILFGSQNPPFGIIEGIGRDEKMLKDLVKDEGMENDVKFVRHEPNIFNLINASDCIVLPSIKDEDFPNIILEAMSLGKPVIASDLSGIPEQINHMRSGILVPPKYVLGLINAIKKLVEDKGLCESLGQSARIRFNAQFTSELAVEQYRKLYNDLVKA